MLRWSLVALLVASPAVGVHPRHGSELHQEEPIRRIYLSSRGEVNNLERSEISPWEARKSLTGDAGMAAAIPYMEDLDQESVRIEEEMAPFIQEVNGSTPTGWMQMGTPPKWLYAIYDTGSDKLVAKTWDTLSSELATIDQGVSGDVMPSSSIYNHDTSSTYSRKYRFDEKSKKKVPLKQKISYGSGVAVTDEGSDTVQVGRFVLKNFSVSEITQDSLSMLHTKKGVSGVLGLQHMKNRSLGQSFFSRMREDNMFDSFGYCRGTGDNGKFIWGDTSTEGDGVDVLGQMHWAVNVSMIQVHGNGSAWKRPVTGNAITGDAITRVTDPSQTVGSTLQEPTEEVSSGDDDLFAGADENEVQLYKSGQKVPCADGKCCGILDTGSNIIAGPTNVMKAISDQVNVAQDCSNFASLPPISFLFGGKNVTVHPEGYVMKVPMPKWATPLNGQQDTGMTQKGQGTVKSDLQFPATSELELEARQQSSLGWKGVFKHLWEKHGIDLSFHFRSSSVPEKTTKAGAADIGKLALNASTASSEFLCMPALVPLDKHTKFGPLYVIGTPLLQTHYARWSFKKGDESPKIYLKEMSECETCKKARATPMNMSASLQEMRSAGPIMRSERPHWPGMEAHQRKGPVIREIEDITFPHWARDIENL